MEHIINLVDPTLYKAVKDDDINTFISTLQLISREKDILEQSILDRLSPSKNSLLHEAAKFGSKEIALHIVDNFPSILTRKNMIGDTPLHVAAKFGKLHIIEVLSTVDFGKQRHGGSLEGPSHADDFVNDNKQLLRIRNHIGNTALHEAVITKNLAEVKYLVSIDPEVAYYLNEEKKSPFYLAVETNDKDIFKALLEEARDLNDAVERPRPRGESPIYAIILKRNKASKGYLEGVKFLLKYSEKSTLERSIKGNFPIHAACKNGHVDIVNELLEQQWPDPTEFLNNEGHNILHIAAKSGKHVVVKNLLRNPKLEMLEINAKDNLGNTALHLASMNLHPNVVFSLTWEDKRVDLELRNNDVLTAIDVLADRGSVRPSTLREV
ncbi:protein ACCELERATED CELL DEATH 6-like isoform X3 [Fagus crenata]